MPKEKGDHAKSGVAHMKHVPLDEHIQKTKLTAEGLLKKVDRRKLAAERRDAEDDGLNAKAEFLDAKTSKKIMQQAQEQRDEESRAEMSTSAASEMHAGGGKLGAGGIGMGLLAAGESESEEEGEEEFEDEEYEMGEDGYVDIAEVGAGLSEAESAVMSSFFGGAVERRTINDLIMDKIREKEEMQAASAQAQDDSSQAGHSSGGPRLPPKVVAVYTEIAQLLKHYSAGKLPKAFKIIPSLTNWEEVLWLTKPDEWSPASVLAATRIFASNFNERMAQRFFNLILLGRVQADIETHGRLNYHLFASLRKAVYKPAAFYRGILLPLAAGSCSLKEATVVAACLSKVSVPANHSAVCLLKLCELPYSGPTSLFIRVLLNKKYALPHRVIDAVSDHFLSFVNEKRELPVLWHQSLLVFAQRYKHDVTAAQKEALKALFKAQYHHQITPEVRRELFSGHSRGEGAQAAELAAFGAMRD